MKKPSHKMKKVLLLVDILVRDTLHLNVVKIEIIPTISLVFILKKYPALSNIFGLVSGSYVYSQESTSFKLMRHSESLIGFYYCIISLKAKTETLLYHWNDLRTKKIKLFKTKIE